MPNMADKHMQIEEYEPKIMKHCKKSILFNKKEQWTTNVAKNKFGF